MKELTEDEFNSFLITLLNSKAGLRRKMVHLKKFVEENTESSPQDILAMKKVGKITYKEIILKEELKTYKGTLEWEDNKKYLILYGTGSYSIVTGSKVDTDEEIIENYRQSLTVK